MEVQTSNEIKKLVIIGMVSDDELMDRLVLKGGNALDIIYGVSTRSSVDLDFSMEDEFQKEDLEDVKKRIERRLGETFSEHDYMVFDVLLEDVPSNVTEDMRHFWGGYKINFKVIMRSKYEALIKEPKGIESVRRQAEIVGPQNSRTFKVDISKFEFVEGKEQKDIEGFTVNLYTPAMIICEKIRAICQQIPEYANTVKKKTEGRARDFFDIYYVHQEYPIDFHKEETTKLLESIFNAKKVPLSLISKIHLYRDFHKGSFPAVISTVRPEIDLEEFDFYFDFVIDLCKEL